MRLKSMHARAEHTSASFSRGLADGSITRGGEKQERKRRGRERERKRKRRKRQRRRRWKAEEKKEDEKGRTAELLRSQDTSRMLYRTIQVRSTCEKREEFNPSPKGDLFPAKNSTRFTSSVIRFIFNLGLIVLSRDFAI